MKILLLLVTSAALWGQTSSYNGLGNSSPYTDTGSIVWAADNGCTSSTQFTVNNTITGTNDPTLYQHGRLSTSAFSCTYSVTNSIFYTITLKFANTQGFTTGQRIFNIFINNALVRANFDLAATAPSNTAFDLGFVIPVSTGQVTINLQPTNGGVLLNAIGITAIAPGTLTSNNTWTGNNTFSGTNTLANINNRILGGSPTYPCTPAGLQTAITALGSAGGTADFSGCIGTISANITNATGSIAWGANITVLLGPSTWTCTITTASTPCWWMQGNGAQLIGGGSGTANQAVDPANNAALGTTNLLCSSCGTTTDMVRVFVPTASRTTAVASIINSNVVAGLFINMGNSGREAVYITSGWKFDFHDLQGFNFVGNGLHIEADVSTTFGVASYNWHVSNVIMQPIAANTTGSGIFIDAINGEVAYFHMESIRARGNVASGGGLAGLLMQTSGAATQSIDTANISDSTFGDPNPAAQGGGWGIKMKATGTWPTSSLATINNIHLNGVLLEHQFGPASGTGIGCTNGSDTPSGAACGSHSFNGLNAGGWTLGIDRANMGEAHAELSASLQDFGSPSLRASGTDTGPNAQFLRVDGQANATAINQFEFGAVVSPTFHDKGFSGQTAYGMEIAPTLASGATAANFTNWAPLHLDGSGLPNGTGLYVTNSLARFATGIRLDETTDFGAGANIDVCHGDSALHAIKCSYNNGTFFQVPLVGIANTWSANQSFNSGTLLPSAAGGTDLGSTALPFGNLWLGTAATNNFKFQPATTGAARTISIPDPGANSNLALVPCITSQKTETAADTNVLTCTPVAAVGSYRVRFILSLSAASAATLGWTATWTDSNGNAQTPTNLSLFQSGVAAPALTFTTSAVANYYGDANIDINNAGTAIVIKLTFSGTSFTGKVSATVERIV